jgi:hypothetical protein
MPIVIRGTANEVYDALSRAYNVTQYRKHEGWELFQIDEEWVYETEKDDKVCPTCLSFQHEWNGTALPIEFSSWTRPSHPFKVLSINEIYPDTHTTHPPMKGTCRCVVSWPNYLNTLSYRLMEEIRGVV